MTHTFRATDPFGGERIMKMSKSTVTLRNFKDLRAFIDKTSDPLPPCPDEPAEKMRIPPDPAKDQKLFQEAMADVKPLSKDNRIPKKALTRPPIESDSDTDSEVILRLRNLVKTGEGFVVADTPEYIEGIGFNVNPHVTQRLHRGDFSVQAHIDLHGLSVVDARETLAKFLKDAIMTGKRMVLIVHGRGLSSTAGPVLKTKVIEWLTCAPWRKWVIAFSSARSCDGGAGATYVLLRQRPCTKRYRKRTLKY
jgi:DNA-nicking Smr family endonuclease